MLTTPQKGVNAMAESVQEIPVNDVSHSADGSCGCGGEGHGEPDVSAGAHPDPNGFPVLDARVVPHSVRHATVFGVLADVPAGSSMILVAPHDPIPLLNQIADRENGQISVSYEISGPDFWRLRLERAA